MGVRAAGNRGVEQADDAVTSATHDSMNRLLTRAPGGAMTFAGSLNEATVTIATQVASVDSANSFRGTAAVATGTSIVAVAATDASGNTATQHYEVDTAGSTTTYTYDANGDLTAQGSEDVRVGCATNRLMRVRDGGTEIASFAYDGVGRRAQKVAAGVTRSYIYDSEDILEERISGGATSRHVHGPGDRSAAGNRRWQRRHSYTWLITSAVSFRRPTRPARSH